MKTNKAPFDTTTDYSLTTIIKSIIIRIIIDQRLRKSPDLQEAEAAGGEGHHDHYSHGDCDHQHM